MSQHNDPIGFQPSGKGPEHGRLLVVVLHGWRGSPDSMKDVVQAVHEAYEGTRPRFLHTALTLYTALTESLKTQKTQTKTGGSNRKRTSRGNGYDLLPGS